VRTSYGETDAFFVERQGEVAIVTPRCDLDLAQRDPFIECLEATAREVSGRIVVSMLHCNYVDSSALNALAVVRRTLKERLVLAVPPTAQIARVFAITGFHRVVPIYTTVEEALAA
jgi:anti-anti-sigma factor